MKTMKMGALTALVTASSMGFGDAAMAAGQIRDKRTEIGYLDGEKMTTASDGFDSGGAGGITPRQPSSSLVLSINAESATSDAGRTALAASPQQHPVAAIFSGAG